MDERAQGARLRRYRRQRGLSLRAAAEFIGVEVRDLSYFETGQHDDVRLGAWRILSDTERRWALEECGRMIFGDGWLKTRSLSLAA